MKHLKDIDSRQHPNEFPAHDFPLNNSSLSNHKAPHSNLFSEYDISTIRNKIASNWDTIKSDLEDLKSAFNKK